MPETNAAETVDIDALRRQIEADIRAEMQADEELRQEEDARRRAVQAEIIAMDEREPWIETGPMKKGDRAVVARGLAQELAAAGLVQILD